MELCWHLIGRRVSVRSVCALRQVIVYLTETRGMEGRMPLVQTPKYTIRVGSDQRILRVRKRPAKVRRTQHPPTRGLTRLHRCLPGANPWTLYSPQWSSHRRRSKPCPLACSARQVFRFGPRSRRAQRAARPPSPPPGRSKPDWPTLLPP